MRPSATSPVLAGLAASLFAFLAEVRGVTLTGIGDGSSLVKTFSNPPVQETSAFFAFPGFTGGVRVAAGDINGDGRADIIVGAGSGAAAVRVFDSLTQEILRSFDAFPGFVGGVFVAAGDVNGDGFDDIIVGADAGGTPHVKAFNGQTGAELQSFFAFDAAFRGGVRVAAGDVNRDGFTDIIVGAGSNASAVRVFDGQTLAILRSFDAYPGFAFGVFVGAGDINGDGVADIITGAGPGAGPHVKVFSGQDGSELRSFFAFTPSFIGGVRVAAGDVNGDGTADLIAGTGPGFKQVSFFDGRTTAGLGSFAAYGGSEGVFVSHLGVPVTVESAVSRKVHGAKRAFEVQLPLTGTPGVECRSGGATNEHQIVVRFGSAVNFQGAAIAAGKGSVASASGSGTPTLTVNLIGVSDAQTIVLTLAGVSNGTNTTNVNVPIGVLLSDTTGNGSVTASDIAQTKGQSGQPAMPGNFRTDVNLSGAINASDIGVVKSRSGNTLP